MPEIERRNLLNALNIDSQSLIPRTENDFRKENPQQSVEASQTMHRYHHMRLMQSYQRIKEFMEKSQRRQGQGNPLFISKEGSRLMLEKRASAAPASQR